MVNAQEWLDKNYPQEKRKETKQIDARNKELKGELIIKDFSNLERVECGGNKSLTNVELIDLPKISYFHANNCQLTNLTINNCPNISYFNVGNNLLRDTTFLNSLSHGKLTVLSIHSNNFEKQGLEFFSKFCSLKELYLGNCDKENFRKGVHNRFAGSLRPLQELTKLELLNVGKTDIDSGLEYLPNSFRKIGFNNAWRANTACSKISEELEKAAQIPGVTEKLKQEEGTDPEWVNSDYYRIAPWRQARKLNEENLSEAEFMKRVAQQKTQQWLNENYSKDITFLTINGRDLEGNLDLREFVNLKKLDCSNNKLTYLDLSECSSLTHLYCDNNLFTDLDFLKTLPHPKKLKELYIVDNKNISKQNLDFLAPFIDLEELSVENCPFKGSLESLKEMKKLQRISISGTDIDSGLDDLPESCHILICNSNYQSNKKSIKIVKELSKYSGEEGYDLTKWREEKQDNILASIVPSERLFVIRSNVKKFINKWGGKEGEISRLSKLQDPKEFQKNEWFVESVQWTARIIAVSGGILALNDYAVIGGSMAAASPFVEVVTSQIKERIYEKKKREWYEFTEDSEEFLDNYHELLGITKSIKVGELGVISKTFKELKKKVYGFLKDYDKNSDKEIEIDELINERDKLTKELGKLGDIVLAVKKLEEKVISYRQGSLKKEDEKLEEQSEEVQTDTYQIDIIKDNESSSQTEDPPENNSSSPILDNQGVGKGTGNNFWFTNLIRRRKSLTNSKINESYELQNQEQIAQTLHVPPYGVPSSSKK